MALTMHLTNMLGGGAVNLEGGTVSLEDIAEFCHNEALERTVLPM